MIVDTYMVLKWQLIDAYRKNDAELMMSHAKRTVQ